MPDPGALITPTDLLVRRYAVSEESRYPLGHMVTAYGATHVGMDRQKNEDAFAVSDARTGESFPLNAPRVIDAGRQPVLLAISDGMGGERAGEVASALTLDALRRELAHHLRSRRPDAALRTAVERTNDEVASAAHRPGREGMGATLVAALVGGTDAYIAAVGDSRVYVLRRGQLVRLTRDQTMVQYLRDQGVLSAEDVPAFPYRNVILQAMGRAPSLWLPMMRLSLRRGDRLLLCSDGLSNEVDDDTMRDLLCTDGPLDELCRQLIVLANDHGGHDNITAVLAVADGSSLCEPALSESMANTVEFLDRSADETVRPPDGPP